MKNNSLVSVIIPVYNGEKYLKPCLDSILNQDYANLEILIINDGSIDNTESILKFYVSEDERVSYINVTNGGQGKARNIGIQMARGNYVCFVDADDTIEKEYISVLLDSIIKNNAEMSVCFLNRIFVKKSNLLETKFAYDNTFKLNGSCSILDKPEIILNIMNAPYCKLISKKFLIENDIKFLEGKIFEDAYFTHTLLSKGIKLSVNEKRLYNYFVRSGTTMTSNTRVNDIFDVMDKIYGLYDNKYQMEIDYYMFHHVCIGSVYRAFNSNIFSVFATVNNTRKFIKNHKITIKNNSYLRKKPLYIKLFALLYS